MKELQKKINEYINTAIGYAILIILLGLVMLIFPGLSLDIIRWSIALVLIIGGLVLMINDFRRQTLVSMFSGSLLGIFLMVLGIIVVVHPDVLSIIPIVLGAYMIISSFMTLRLASSLKKVSTASFFISILTSIIAIICGIVLITNPFGGAIVLTSLIGAVAIIYGISGLVDLIIFRSNVKEVANYLKANAKFIEGEEEK